MHSILFTQSLQNDFVKPVGRYDPLPNRLHVGYEEARRLMGENPAEGPVAKFMRWAYGKNDDVLKVIHIRDWHLPANPRERLHLEQFGPHCIRDTEGAAFAFTVESSPGKDIVIVDSPSLNDFIETPLRAILGGDAGQALNVGIIGLWTEAKVFFLAYELRTRYPEFQIGVCSALCASSSRAQHFVALDQMKKLLGVHVFSSVGQFTEFLGGQGEDLPLIGYRETGYPAISMESPVTLAADDETLLRYLFRDSRSARFKVLDGGFSGNMVLGSQSQDMFGHRQVPHVVKIGPHDLIGRERSSFERIESVLGNNAPHIADFADLGSRGAIKYRYASMGGSHSLSFQKLYMSGIEIPLVKKILSTVFQEQLGRLYSAAGRERSDLLEYYCFSKDYAPKLRERIESLIGSSAAGEALKIAEEIEAPNVVRFYENLDRLPRPGGQSTYFAYIHGDLNGANIIIDEQMNVWLIDFFHTHYGHILKDLIKLENDILYIFTPLENEAELKIALRLCDVLVNVEDLAAPLPAAAPLPEAPPLPAASQAAVRSPAEQNLLRAYETISFLRSLYPGLIRSDGDPLQLLIGLLRYAMHTISFDESSVLQKKLALYAGCQAASRISAILNNRVKI